MFNFASRGSDRNPSFVDIDSLSLVMHCLAEKRVRSNGSSRQIFSSPHSLKANFSSKSCWLSLSLSDLNVSISSSPVYSRQSNQANAVSSGSRWCVYMGGYYICFDGWENKFDCQFDWNHDQEWFMKPLIQYLLTKFLVLSFRLFATEFILLLALNIDRDRCVVVKGVCSTEVVKIWSIIPIPD